MLPIAQGSGDYAILLVMLGAFLGFVLSCVLSAFICKTIIRAFNKQVLLPRARRTNDDEEFIYLNPDLLVPEPEWGRMLGIALFRVIINGCVSLVLGLLYYAAISSALPPAALAEEAQIWSLPLVMPHAAVLFVADTLVSFFVGALVLKGTLPTTFKRACVIQMLEFMVYFVILAIVLGLMYVYTNGTMRM